MTLCVAPALTFDRPSLTAPGASAPGGSFSDELARLQREYRVARGGERGPALRRLRDAMHREMAKEIGQCRKT